MHLFMHRGNGGHEGHRAPDGRAEADGARDQPRSSVS
jgi:hypothetical protein